MDASLRRSAFPWIGEFQTFSPSFSMQLSVSCLLCFAIRTSRRLSSDRFERPITIVEKKTLLTIHSWYASRASKGMSALSSSFPSHWRREAFCVATDSPVSYARFLSTTRKTQERDFRFATHAFGMGSNCGLTLPFFLCACLVHILAIAHRFVSRMTGVPHVRT